MRCIITHSTSYTYSESVGFGNHIIKLTPKPAKHVTLNSHKLTITPTPSMLYRYEETDGSLVYSAFFNTKSKILSFEHVSDVSLEEYNPFDFMISPLEYVRVPFTMNQSTHPDLMPFLHEYEPLSDELKDFIHAVSDELKDSTLDFAITMCSKIREMIAYGKRINPAPQFANETFHLRKGSCRDMARIFLQICRYAGIPSRFVSGYAIKEVPEGENPDLHSWVDLYIPGGGWVAFDPTLGLIPSGGQLALTSSAELKCTTPISGGFIGNADSKLDHLLTYKFL